MALTVGFACLVTVALIKVVTGLPNPNIEFPILDIGHQNDGNVARNKRNAEASCLDGMVNLPGSTQCFKLFLDQMVWSKANPHCISKGLVLARPNDSIAEALRWHLVSIYGTVGGTWISGHATGTQMVWSEDGSAVRQDLIEPDYRNHVHDRYCLNMGVANWKPPKDVTPYGVGHCIDGNHRVLCQDPCGAGKYRCTDGVCISQKYLCDGYTDCKDGADENNCATNTIITDKYRCPNGTRIERINLCDGHINCADGADEEDCPNDTSYETFESKFEKNYTDPDEKVKRLAIVKKTIKKIEEHNALYKDGNVSYRLGVNQFSDLEYEEFISDHTGGLVPSEENEYIALINGIPSPDQVYTCENPILVKSRKKRSADQIGELGSKRTALNYVEDGYVGDIRDQQKCSSCWAFATISSIESQIFKLTGVRAKLSEQHIINCRKELKGCKKGRPAEVYEYARVNGILFDSIYHTVYTGKNGTCQNIEPCYMDKKITISSVRGVSKADGMLLKALVEVGPIVVYVRASRRFKDYKDGIFNYENPSRDVNHVVTLVGYGKENGEDYWLIRNSAGVNWGEKGYMKLSRSKKNDDMLTEHASYPVLKGKDVTAVSETSQCEK